LLFYSPGSRNVSFETNSFAKRGKPAEGGLAPPRNIGEQGGGHTTVRTITPAL